MTDIPTVKTCTKCGETKSADGFSRDPSKRDGLSSQCKECRHAYREAHREEIRAKGRAYYEDHRGERLAYNDAYREAHRDEINAKQRAYNRDYNALLGNPTLDRWREITAKHATRHGRWSEAEDAYIAASTDRVVDDALALKRTHKSVNNRITRLRASGVTLARDAHRR